MFVIFDTKSRKSCSGANITGVKEMRLHCGKNADNLQNNFMSTYQAGPLLSQIQYPHDMREKFKLEDLPQISAEVRQYIIDVISEIGNSHFGASLGVVELTVALHYIFNTPEDQLIWDVGHQAYGHKILTGRREVFHTNRTK